jgi:5-methylcytosine-specific restriction endonuclease McrA
MKYNKNNQLKRVKKLNRTALNRKANKKLKELKNEMDIRHCELCSTQAVTNAHRHKRVYYSGDKRHLLWSRDHVLFLCTACHQRMDDRSKTTEEEKEELFESLRKK